MSSLPELVGKYHGIIEAIYKDLDEGGENEKNLLAEFQDLDLEVAQKIDSYAYVLDMLKKESEYWKDRAAQAKKIEKACKNGSERLKMTIKSTMDFMDTDEVLGVDKRFKLANTAPKLVILNEYEIPDSYKRIVKVTELDKEAIKADLQKEIAVKGAVLEYNKSIRAYANKPKALKSKKKETKK